MNKSRGFTLVELMIVIAIVAILTTLAAPSFKQLIQSNTMSGAVNTFLGDMRFARSEAIRRGGGVVMCRSANPEAVNAVCGTGSTTGWESGWIIFQDNNSNGARNFSTNPLVDDTLLRAQGPITSISSIAEPGAATVFRFAGTGRLTLSAATSIQFGSTPQYTNEVQRVVCVNLGGRARIAGNGLASCTASGAAY